MRRRLRYFFPPRRRRPTDLEQTETRTARKMAALLLRLEMIEKGDKVRVVRCRPGHWQRSAGAWSFVVEVLEGESTAVPGVLRFREVCGSQYSATEILKAKVVIVYTDPQGDRHLDIGKEGDAVFI